MRHEATNGDRTPILPEERDSAGPVDFQRAVEGIQPAPNGAIPRVTVNQFANPPPGSDGIDRARENRFSIGPPNLSPSYPQERSTSPFVARGLQQNHLPPPFVAGGAYTLYSQPPPDLPYGRQSSPVFAKLLQAMLEDNRQRDAMMERLMTTCGVGRSVPQDNCRSIYYRVMPDLSRNIESYDGDDGTKAREWLLTIEGMRTMHNWPNNIALETARSHLKGGAKDWYRMRNQSLLTWQDFSEALRETFVIYESRTAKWQRMTELVQRRGESAQTYYHTKIRLCAELDLNVRDSKEQVLVGLWSKDLCSAMAVRDHHNLQALYHDMMAYEKLEEQRIGRIRSNQTNNSYQGKVPSVNEPPVGASAAERALVATAPRTRLLNPDARPPIKNEAGELKCYNYNKYGHISKDCPEPKRELICRACGQRGHTQRHCTASSTATYGAGESVRTIARSRNTAAKCLKTVHVDGRQLRAIIDQGSSDCTIAAFTVLKEGLHMDPEEMQFRRFGPDHHVVTSPGVVRVAVTVDGVTVRDVPVRVVPDDSQMVPLLIGRTFTDAPNVNYHKVKDELIFVDAESDPFAAMETIAESSSRVEVAETTQLPSHAINFIRATDCKSKWMLPILNMGATVNLLHEGKTLIRGELTELPMLPTTTAAARAPVQREDIVVGQNQPEGGVKDLLSILNEYRDCVATDLAELGCTDVVEMDIVETPNRRPIICKPYKTSNAEREEIKKIFNEWKREGIVTETNSPFASPVFLVKKKTGESRLIVDFRKLNQQTERIHFPLPDIDDHMAMIGNARVFIALDLAHGYLQVPLAKNARKKTAFITPDDTGEFTRMMFGLMNALFFFSKLMQRVLGPLRERLVLFFLDDILIPGVDWPDLRDRFIQTLGALRKAGLTIKLSKCQFLMERVTYLGFVISRDGVEPGSKKLEGIKNFPRPRDVHQVRRFLGLASFFRRFVRRFAERASALTALLKKD